MVIQKGLFECITVWEKLIEQSVMHLERVRRAYAIFLVVVVVVILVAVTLLLNVWTSC